jgi:hypothetical protein
MPLEGPRALGGGPLLGSRPLRYVYIDEAGTSANEPVAIVAGVIVDADRDWMRADAALRALIDRYVPDHFKQDFVFHATAIWGDKKYREGWDFADRLALIHGVLGLPASLGIPITMGGIIKSEEDADFPGITPDESAHAAAFIACASMADDFISTHGRPQEVGTLIAEDIPRMRRLLRHVFHRLRELDLVLPKSQVRYGSPEPVDAPRRIRRLVDTVHFVDKHSGPLLQIADACAFAFRRRFAGQSRGEELVRLMLGKDLDMEFYKDTLAPAGLWCSPDMLKPTKRSFGYRGPIKIGRYRFSR